MPPRKSISASFNSPACLSIIRRRLLSRNEVVRFLKWTQTPDIGFEPSLLQLNLSAYTFGLQIRSLLHLPARICYEGSRGTKRLKRVAIAEVANRSPGRSVTSLWFCAIFLLLRDHRNWCRCFPKNCPSEIQASHALQPSIFVGSFELID